MNVVRVYLPVSVDQLRRLAGTGELAGAPHAAFAVTSGVREVVPQGDEEAYEFVALQEAAAAAAAGGPLLVLSADVPASSVVPTDAESAQVVVSGPVRRGAVAAYHVGDDVLGTGPALGAPDEEIELSWYDPSELDEVLALLA